MGLTSPKYFQYQWVITTLKELLEKQMEDAMEGKWIPATYIRSSIISGRLIRRIHFLGVFLRCLVLAV
jgi:hypothetical protein